MSKARLTYTCVPTQLAISDSATPSDVGITFLATNSGHGDVSIDQIVLTFPQGAGATDLLAPGTSLKVGSVRSSDGSSWSLAASAQQVTVLPVTSSGFGVLAHGGSLQFTVRLCVNAAGAGQSATVGVAEFVHNVGQLATGIAIGKIAPDFRIEAFYLDQYNVAPGSPVTVTWKVAGGLSCSVTAKPLDAGRPRAKARIATDAPVCTGSLHAGDDGSGSRTCTLEGATIFTLDALGKGIDGDITLTSQLLATVNDPAVNFTGFPPVLDRGQNLQLKWRTADAGKLQLYVVPAEGQPTTLDLTDRPVDSAMLQPVVNTNFVLYAFVDANDNSPAKQSEFYVTVEEPKWTKDFVVGGVPDPAYPGDTVTLDWTVTDVDHCRLTCDLPGFAKQEPLPLAGPRPLVLPDPGVAQAIAHFTMTPVEFGSQGDATAQTVPVTITNTPHVSKSLAASPTAGAPGAAIALTWTADHADAGAVTDDVPGSTWSQPVDPASGAQTVNLPATVLPGPVNFTLTLTRGPQKYASTTTAAVQCNVTVPSSWFDSDIDSPPINYLDTLYAQHPNRRIRRLGLSGGDNFGVAAIYIWYGDGANADYVFKSSFYTGQGPDSTLDIASGDYLVAATAYYGVVDTGSDDGLGLQYLQLTTQGGKSLSAGFQSQRPQQSLSAGAGNQVIALGWAKGEFESEPDSVYPLGSLGLFICPASYGG